MTAPIDIAGLKHALLRAPSEIEMVCPSMYSDKESPSLESSDFYERARTALPALLDALEQASKEELKNAPDWKKYGAAIRERDEARAECDQALAIIKFNEETNALDARTCESAVAGCEQMRVERDAAIARAEKAERERDALACHVPLDKLDDGSLAGLTKRVEAQVHMSLAEHDRIERDTASTIAAFIRRAASAVLASGIDANEDIAGGLLTVADGVDQGAWRQKEEA